MRSVSMDMLEKIEVIKPYNKNIKRSQRPWQYKPLIFCFQINNGSFLHLKSVFPLFLT